MGWIVWGVILPTCGVASWWIVRHPARLILEELHADRARARFRREREWLEAGFLTNLGRIDPAERPRWEDARWGDRVHWARDHRTRRLLALVEVLFEADPFDDASPAAAAGHATALFEYRKGRWFADGKRLDATRPHEAFLHPGRFLPVEPPRGRP